MELRASQLFETTSQGPFHSSHPPRCSISTQRTTLEVRLRLTSARRKCRLSTASSAFRITSDSSGTASTAKFLDVLVSSAISCFFHLSCHVNSSTGTINKVQLANSPTFSTTYLLCVTLMPYLGTANFVNRKRAVTICESVEQENERQKLLYKLF